MLLNQEDHDDTDTIIPTVRQARAVAVIWMDIQRMNMREAITLSDLFDGAAESAGNMFIGATDENVVVMTNNRMFCLPVSKMHEAWFKNLGTKESDISYERKGLFLSKVMAEATPEMAIDQMMMGRFYDAAPVEYKIAFE